MSADHQTENFKGYGQKGGAIHFVYKADPNDTWSSESPAGTFDKDELLEMLSMFDPPEDEEPE